MVADLRPFVVELSSRENTQRRRVSLLASSRDEAEHVAVTKEAEYVDYRLDGERLAAASAVARFVHKDSDIDGRFIRAGKTIRTRDLQAGSRRVQGLAHRGGVTLGSGVGNTDTSALRAILATHNQETPYRVDRVGDPSIQNAVTAVLFGVPWQKQIDGSGTQIVYSSDTMKVALFTGYTLDQDAHDFFNDITTEITGTGYTAGGATLASKTSTYDTASDQIRLDAADPSWTTSTLSATDAVIYKSTGTSSTSPVLAAIDFGATVTTTAGTFQITFDATGWAVFDLT